MMRKAFHVGSLLVNGCFYTGVFISVAARQYVLGSLVKVGP